MKQFAVHTSAATLSDGGYLARINEDIKHTNHTIFKEIYPTTTTTISIAVTTPAAANAPEQRWLVPNKIAPLANRQRQLQSISVYIFFYV